MGAADRKIVVCGATGRQGRAVIDALREAIGPWKIKALTRNPMSRGARALAALGIDIVMGDLDAPDTLARAFEGAHGVYSVQANFVKDDGREVRFGRNVVDAAVQAGVAHLVYGSVGGAERDSGVPHFEAKRQIELHLLESGLPATILRPASFMDNFAVFPMRTIVLSMLKTFLSPATRLQLVATKDIGRFAARAFEEPDRFVGKQIELAGDSLTVSEIVRTLRTGGVRPTLAFDLPNAVVKRLPADFPIMVRWFERHGFQADIDALRRELPALRSLHEWTRGP